jgi:hypothetical protein
MMPREEHYMGKKLEQIPDARGEYRMDGTYKPYRVGPGNNGPQMPATGMPSMPNGKKWYNYNPNNIPDGRSVYDHLKEDMGNAWREEGDWVEKNLPSFKGFFGR